MPRRRSARRQTAAATDRLTAIRPTGWVPQAGARPQHAAGGRQEEKGVDVDGRVVEGNGPDDGADDDLAGPGSDAGDADSAGAVVGRHRDLGGSRPARGVARWLPETLRQARIDPGRPGALTVIAVALLAAVVTGVLVWRARPVPQPIGVVAADTTTRAGATPHDTAGADPATGDAAGSDLASAAAAGAAPQLPGGAAPTGPATVVVVAVAGKVRRPGLVRLPAGDRVADAIAAAGGVLPGADIGLLNVASRLSDGEQVLVGIPGATPDPAAPAAPAADAGATQSPDAPVNLNTATLEQLDALPGVGPVTAAKILDYRTAHGPFRSIDQLRDVGGIGDVKFAALESKVTV